MPTPQLCANGALWCLDVKEKSRMQKSQVLQIAMARLLSKMDGENTEHRASVNT